MMKNIAHFLSLIALVLVSACSLSSAPPTASPETIAIQPTAFIPATITPAPTNTPPPTSTSPSTVASSTSLVQAGGQQTRCTVRGDWPLYTVVRGDTLASIARRTGSTVSALVAANCLADANVISVGQSLRVPVVPSAPPPSSGLTAVGSVTVSPASFATNTYFVAPGSVLTLTWADAPRTGADTIEFISYPASPSSRMNGLFTVVGTDTELSNGAAVVHTVSSGGVGYFGAVAKRNGVEVSRTQYDMAYSISAAPSQFCTATVNVPGTNLYSGPGTNYAIVSSIAGADAFPIIGRSGGWYQLSYPNQPQAWIDAAVIAIAGDCSAVPTVNFGGQPCAATVSVPAANVHNGAGSNYQIISTVAGGDQFNILGQPPSGAVWYNIQYPTDGQAWIDGTRVTLSGNCDNIPYVSSTRPPVSPTSSYQVTVAPTTGTRDGWITLQAGSTVELNITYTGDNPPLRVEYYLAPTGTGMTPTLIGSAEGTSSWGASWTVQSGVVGYVNAKVYAASGNVYDTTAIQVMVQ